MSEYPPWICSKCANALNHPSRCAASSFHVDICGWCLEEKEVTEPRDYGYPPWDKKREPFTALQPKRR